MLGRMRFFYRTYPQMGETLAAPLAKELTGLGVKIDRVAIPSPAVTKSKTSLPTALDGQTLMRLSWSHIIELIRVEDPWKRAFYENECLRAAWSKRELQSQIGSLLYERTGLSVNKRAVIERARRETAEARIQISELIRDPYVLEFVGLAERSTYTESDLETALLDHLQSFLLELGSGFCFEARQKRITAGNENDYRSRVLPPLTPLPFTHRAQGSQVPARRCRADELLLELLEAEGDQSTRQCARRIASLQRKGPDTS